MRNKRMKYARTCTLTVMQTQYRQLNKSQMSAKRIEKALGADCGQDRLLVLSTDTTRRVHLRELNTNLGEPHQKSDLGLEVRTLTLTVNR